MLCYPEDAALVSRCTRAPHVLRGHCRVPMCHDCWWKSRGEKYGRRIPVALTNDNFAGYASDIISRYTVRWLEAAVASPCWTNTLILYVEGVAGIC